MKPSEFVRIIEKKIGDRRDFWTREADLASDFAGRVMFPAYRGCFLWMDGVAAIFSNVGEGDKNEPYYKEFLDELEPDQILAEGETPDQYSWVILYDICDDKRKLDDLLWDKVISNAEKSAIGDVFFMIKKEEAEKVIGQYAFIPVKQKGVYS